MGMEVFASFSHILLRRWNGSGRVWRYRGAHRLHLALKREEGRKGEEEDTFGSTHERGRNIGGSQEAESRRRSSGRRKKCRHQKSQRRTHLRWLMWTEKQ